MTALKIHLNLSISHGNYVQEQGGLLRQVLTGLEKRLKIPQLKQRVLLRPATRLLHLLLAEERVFLFAKIH